MRPTQTQVWISLHGCDLVFRCMTCIINICVFSTPVRQQKLFSRYPAKQETRNGVDDVQ